MVLKIVELSTIKVIVNISKILKLKAARKHGTIIKK